MNKYKCTTHLVLGGGYFVTLTLVELVFFAILCSLFYYPKIVFLRRNLYSVSNQNAMLQIKEWHTSTSFDPWWHCFPIGSPLAQHCRWRASSLPITGSHWGHWEVLGHQSAERRKDTFSTLEERDKVSDLKKELSSNSIQPSSAQHSFLDTFFLCQPVVRVLLWITCLD